MPFKYVSVDEAIARRGLRMVVVGGVPSPWGEAAKGILHIKGVDWVAVRLAFDSEPLSERVEILGAPRLRVVLACDRPVAFLVARLCDVAPDGSSVRSSSGKTNGMLRPCATNSPSSVATTHWSGNRTGT